jgi:hypothetical protein
MSPVHHRADYLFTSLPITRSSAIFPVTRTARSSQFESRDKQGNLIRYNADDDEITLGELVRQEKFGAGQADQKNLDAEMAAAIGRDARFQVS